MKFVQQRAVRYLTTHKNTLKVNILISEGFVMPASLAVFCI